MNVVRTILAALIAASVALLPMRIAVTGTIEQAGAASVQSTQDCCAHQAAPCDTRRAAADCAASCAIKCFNFALFALIEVSVPLAVAARDPLPLAPILREWPDRPPFHPPKA